MNKLLKMFILAAAILLILNVAVKEGYASTNKFENAEEIKDYEFFGLDFDITEKDPDDGKYKKYFKINLPKKGIITLMSSGPEIHIYKPNGENLNENEKSEYLYMFLEQGTYYISLESKVAVKDAFLIGLVTEQFLEEKEPNDTFDKANDLTRYVNESLAFVKGSFKSATDVDLYKFTLKNDYTKVDVDINNIKKLNASFNILDSKGNKVKYKTNIDGSIEAGLPKGTYYFQIKGSSKANGKDYILASFFEKTIPPLNPKDIIIQNNYIGNDIVTIKNAKKGIKYSIEWEDGETSKTNKKGESKLTFNDLKLRKKGGTITVTAYDEYNTLLSEIEVKYGPAKLPTLSAKNVTIKNNIGKDTIKFKGLTKGLTYTVYKDAKLKKKIASFKATKSTKTITVKQLGKKAGAVYIVASKKGYKSSNITKVKFKAQPTPALSSKYVKVINGKKQDTIKLKGLKKGTTYIIYKDAKLKKKIASFKATKSTKTIKVKQLGKKAGNIYIVVQKPGYEKSKATKVSYSKE